MVRNNRRKCSGQVLVIALLGSALLAGMVFYVANAGDQVNRRVAMQNAADAAAISGASFMARCMNVIGMNNVAETRMLTLIPILDAFPLAVKMSFEETNAWTRCLERQLSRPFQADPTGPYLKSGLQVLHDRMARQRDVLGPMNEYLNPGGNVGEPITPLTTWFIRGSPGLPPHGTLWQATQSLDEFTQATWASAGVLSQADSVRWGAAAGAEVAFVVPIIPQLPGKRTTFGDYQRPIREGRIPDHVDHKRLGPYDRLFKWRDYRYENITEPDHIVPGQQGHGPIRGGGGNAPGAARSNGNSARGYTTDPNEHWSYRTVGTRLLGYTVYGPYEWMMRRIHGYAQGWWQDRGYSPGELSDTYFHQYHRQLADIKLNYMFNSSAPQPIHYPMYELGSPPDIVDLTDYAVVKQLLATRPEIKVSKTMFYLVEIRSKYPKDSPLFLSPGTFRTNARDDSKTPIAMWMNGWQDPETWKKVQRLVDYVWEDQYTYETTEDWDIGIVKEPDPMNPGQDKWQKVYMISQYVFGGIDVGANTEVTNPANFSDRNELPAPLLMDTSAGDYDLSQPNHDLGVRRDVYTYLGVAKQRNDPLIWAPRFGSGNPFHGVTAVAQVEVFNTTSWDLWTQDWKAKLVPVSGWRDWTERMAAGIGAAADTNGLVDANVVQAIQEYFSRFDERMVNEMMNH